MGENVQCPVCTLFLHAGMNLSDHLETHPKEQVIKALVQMTISGGAGTAASTALATSLSGGGSGSGGGSSVGETKREPDEKSSAATSVPIAVKSDEQSNTAANSSTTVEPKLSNNSLNFAAAFSAIPAVPAIPKSLIPSNTPSNSSSPSATERPGGGITMKNIAENNINNGNGNEKIKVALEVAAAAAAASQAAAQAPAPSNVNEQAAASPLQGASFDGYASGIHQTHQKQLKPSQLVTQQPQQRQQQQQSQQQQRQQHQQSQQKQRQQQQAQKQSQHQQQQQQQHLQHHQQTQKQHIDSAPTSNAITQQRTSFPPPPPPPMVSMPIVVGQMPNKLLQQAQQAHPTTLFPTNLTTHRHVQMHPVQQSHQQLQHQYQQQQQQQQQNHIQQQQQQQQQNLKIYYSTALPTPPTGLQLFPFHASAQLQHQKPPPAYGTAISQIRSQHNQNKNNPTTGDKNHISHQHQLHEQVQRHQHQQRQQQQQQLQQKQTQQQRHPLQQQQQQPQPQPQQQPQPQPQPPAQLAIHNHNLRPTTLRPQQPQVTSTGVNTAMSTRHHHHLPHTQQTLENMPTLSVKPLIGSKSTDLPPPPPPPPPARAPTNLQHHHPHHHLPHPLSHLGIPMKSSIALQQQQRTVTDGSIATDCITNGATIKGQVNAVVTTSNNSSSSAAFNPPTPAIISIASAGGIRQVTSPYNSLLLSAAQSPSASSVLRYAESPVAHYLERDNGDFIVQETPKHIVECVEKEDGEFSVIEHIYQSPLSVLHIHEDDDDEKEDDEDDDDNDGSDGHDDANGKCDVKENDKNKVSTANEQNNKDAADEPMEIDDSAGSSKRDSSQNINKSQTNADDKRAVDNEKIQTKTQNKDKPVAPNSSNSSSSNNCNANTNSAGTDTNTSCDTISTSNSNSNSSSNTNSESNTNQSSNAHATGTSKKRSSKNTITVLSDVQLNLDEYLDLVGNIIASSKITAKSSMLSGTMPLPLLKVEKEEPPDDDYEIQNHQQQDENDDYFEDQQNEFKKFTESTVTEEPPTIANIKETELVVENNNCSSSKVRINDSENEKTSIGNDVMLHIKNGNQLTSATSTDTSTANVTTSTCGSHVTSVIRMATTSQQQQQQQQQQHQHPQMPQEFGEKQSTLSDVPASSAQTMVTSIIIQNLSRQHIIQLQEDEQTPRVESPKPLSIAQSGNGSGTDLLLSQLQRQEQDPQTEAEEKMQEQKQINPSITLPVQKRGPKKLIIKPKITKTDPNDNLNNSSYNINNNTSNNFSNHNSTKTKDIKDIKPQIINSAEAEEAEVAIEERPSTSTKAQMELKEKIQQQIKRKEEQQVQNTIVIAHDLIKKEPTTSSYDCISNRIGVNGGTSKSILENHLNSSTESKIPIIQCKTEQSFDPPINYSNTQPLKEELKEVNNSNDDAAANDDARVLLDFANSKKRSLASPDANVNNFLSVASIFSNTSNAHRNYQNHKQTTAATTTPTNTNTNSSADSGSAAGLRCEDEFIAHDEVQEIVISSSYSQSQSASDIPITNSGNKSTATNQGKAINALQQQQQQQQHQQHQTPAHHHRQQQQQQQQQHLSHNFSDYPFSFLYGNGSAIGVSAASAGVGQQLDTKSGNFSAIYQQATQDATTAATLASGSNTIQTDESTCSSQQQQQHQQRQQHSSNHFGNVHAASGGGGGEIGSNASHWYHQAMATTNPDFEAALAVDCNAAIDGGDVGKYLDLDTCKREVVVGSMPPAAPSSTSSSFAAAATDSSLAGGCTADALNVRTDEKMPAKGEISGQESNCDIENSWSQPMYGEISARFFKTTFPGIFQHENGWNHDEYFTVQDLSASAAAAGNAATSNRTAGKSFDFRLPLEATTSAAANGIGNNGSGNFQLFARHHTDTLPSTSSSSNKKKRKRENPSSSSDTAAGRIEKAALSRMQPTATITSQQLLFHQQQQHQTHQSNHQLHNNQQPLQAHEHLLQQPQHTATAASAFISSGISSTPAAVAAGIAAAASDAENPNSLLIAEQRRQQRKKVYQCTHCTAEFPKLKDRNSHMIMQHNYVRQNRRLICVQRPTTVGSAAAASSAAAAAAPSSSSNATAVDGDVNNVAVINMADGYDGHTLVRADSMEFLEDSKHGIVKIEVDNAYQSITAGSVSAPVRANGVDAKPELTTDDDNKQSMALVPAGSVNENGNENVSDTADAVDTKPTIQPLAMTTPATKLAALYRMLVSYNISTLKDSHNLSEMEQKLIEQSIFFCYVCRRNFTSVKLYDAHLIEHPAECFTCGKTFQRWKNFSLHLKRHLGWKEFGCNVCDKKFVVRSALVEHMRMHTGQTPLRCKVCGKYFKRYSNLTQHRKRHGKQIIRRKEYVCYCGEVLPSKARLLWHKETHDAKPKCCPYCCDRFVHANSLRRHIRLAHSDKFDYTEPMECPLCKQTFAKNSMKAHMATHSMDTQHDCVICNKSFSTKWNLKIHSWVHANRTAKPFKCEHCPKAFVREVDFKNHMNAHKQIKPYTCEYCGCKFIRKYNYMRHRREHHGNKKFTCDLCKKSFHRHYYLIEHRRIHTGERPFQCTICGKSSTTKTNHNKHLKIHHSRDPFTVEA